jgi:hypothetical protein
MPRKLSPFLRLDKCPESHYTDNYRRGPFLIPTSGPRLRRILCLCVSRPRARRPSRAASRADAGKSTGLAATKERDFNTEATEVHRVLLFQEPARGERFFPSRGQKASSLWASVELGALGAELLILRALLRTSGFAFLAAPRLDWNALGSGRARNVVKMELTY